jgi:hypothetical protein
LAGLASHIPDSIHLDALVCSAKEIIIANHCIVRRHGLLFAVAVSQHIDPGAAVLTFGDLTPIADPDLYFFARDACRFFATVAAIAAATDCTALPVLAVQTQNVARSRRRVLD